MITIKSEEENDDIVEAAVALEYNEYIPSGLPESTGNNRDEVISTEDLRDLSNKNCHKTHESNTSSIPANGGRDAKQKQFKVRLSYFLGYGDKDVNTIKCSIPKEPKKFIICRFSQIVLILLVFAYYCYAVFIIILSYNPPKHVPCLDKRTGASLENKQLNESIGWAHQCTSNITLVNKCCPLKQSFRSKNDLTCAYDKSVSEFIPFKGKVFSKLKEGQTLTDLQLKRTSTIVIIPAQFNNTLRYKILEEDSYLMEDGVLLTETLIFHDSRDFCSEFIVKSNTTVLLRVIKGRFRYFVGDTKDTLLWFCLAPLSIVALLIVTGIYMFQQQLRNLHGKMLICYLLCQIGFYLTTTIHKFPAKDSFFSYCFNYALQFSILAQHFWMIAMCFDMWIVFSRPLRRPGNQKHCKFLIYSVVSWGCAASLCACTAAVGVVPHVSDSCPKPRFEHDACFFSRRRTEDLFFNTPMALTLCLNLVMFLATVVNIRFLHVEKGLQNQPAVEGGLLYLKLSLLMGINWFLVWVGFRVEAMRVYLYVRALISTQGVLLAVVLICNNRIWNILRGIVCKKC